MSDGFVVLSCAALTAGLVGAVAFGLRRMSEQRRRFVAAFGDDDAECIVDVTADDAVLLRSKGARVPVVLVALDGGDDGPSRWEARAKLPQLAMRTTLDVARGRAGRDGVDVGTPLVDDLLALAGSDAGVVRALFSSPQVQEAARALFVDSRASSLVLEDSGALVCEIERNGLDPEEARLHLRRSCKLVAALDDCAALAPIAASPGAFASERSGAPVAVPTATATVATMRGRG